MSINKEKLVYIEHFDAVTSITDTGNILVIGSSKPEQFSKFDVDSVFEFKTTFDNKSYLVSVCDDKIIYSSLLAWRNLKYTSLFQEDHEIIYDDTHGKMKFAERTNYLYTLKVARELLNKKNYNIYELYDVINKMINYKEFKILSEKGEYKLSKDFFEKYYVPLISYSSRVEYPKDILEFNKNREINNPQKLLKKYYRNK